jgi:hypothetical protein
MRTAARRHKNPLRLPTHRGSGHHARAATLCRRVASNAGALTAETSAPFSAAANRRLARVRHCRIGDVCLVRRHPPLVVSRRTCTRTIVAATWSGERAHRARRARRARRASRRSRRRTIERRRALDGGSGPASTALGRRASAGLCIAASSLVDRPLLVPPDNSRGLITARIPLPGGPSKVARERAKRADDAGQARLRRLLARIDSLRRVRVDSLERPSARP